MTLQKATTERNTTILEALYLIREESIGASDEAREHGIDRLGDAPLHQILLVAEAAAKIVCADQDDAEARAACRIYLRERMGDEGDEEYRQALWLARSIRIMDEGLE
jgi:hypothetical protein